MSSDYLQVHNSARGIYQQQEHQETIHNFSFVHPITGLFHPQLDALKVIMHAFDGVDGASQALR